MAADPWADLLAAWQAWTRSPSDRRAAVRLTDASRPVAPLLGVPAYQVSTVLAAELREGGTQAEVIERLRARHEETT
jgi:hypothetical protein